MTRDYDESVLCRNINIIQVIKRNVPDEKKPEREMRGFPELNSIRPERESGGLARIACARAPPVILFLMKSGVGR